jgi:ADP-ribose pyrophosphatase YjhB (NUDIX family)
MSNPQWIEWAQRLQALAQNGLTFNTNPYDVSRYEAVQAIAAEILSEYSQTDESVVLDLFKKQSGYATPKVDTRGVIFQGDKILLVKELLDGLWTFPGGWADVTESPSIAVQREVREEAGLLVRPVKLLSVYDRNKHGHPPYPFSIYKLFFLCEITGQAPADTLETASATFYGEDEIPALSIDRCTPEEVTRMFEHHRHPDWPTDFD